MAWLCRFLTARAPDSLVDFRTGTEQTPHSGRTVTGVRAAISDVKSLRTCLKLLTRLPRSQGSEAEAAAARAAAAAARAALDEQRSSSDQGESGRQTRSGGRRSKEPEHDESEMPRRRAGPNASSRELLSPGRRMGRC